MLLFLVVLNFYLIFCEDPTISKWPKSFFARLVTTITPPGGDGPTFNFQQMVVYDGNENFTCRYDEQNLLNHAIRVRPVDYCSNADHYRIQDGSGLTPPEKITCSMNQSHFPRFEWPSQFLDDAKFVAVDKVNGRSVNHFFVQNMMVKGVDTQVDIWLGQDDGLVALMTFLDVNTDVITTYSFVEIQSGYPNSALRCTSALIKCGLDDALCRVKNGTAKGDISAATSWICTPGAGNGNLDCSPIEPGGKFYEPDTVLAHGNWAFNAYFQKNKYIDGMLACLSINGVSGDLVIPPTSHYQKKKLHRYSRPVKANLFDTLTPSFVC